MAIRKLRLEGDEILRKKSREVTVIDDKIKMILNDMVDTMYKNDGVGLAAPQIGLLKRLVVIDVGDEHVYKMINPKITASSGKELDQEGCLSVPEIKGDVLRPTNVTCVYTNENGEEITLQTEDHLLARCICHELDHLEGTLFIDKMKKQI
ncbi:MAG: peptide deformylase [Bacillota bacterium]|jgi:peptide deformylase|nr:peptide deformylase [Bacillota bacterium]